MAAMKVDGILSWELRSHFLKIPTTNWTAEHLDGRNRARESTPVLETASAIPAKQLAVMKRH